jgi:hypothetical protein
MIAFAFTALVATAATLNIQSDATEAAITWLLQRAAPSQIICLDVDGNDPDPALGTRLRDLGPWLPASSCRVLPAEHRSTIVQTTDGREAEFLSLGAVVQADETHATIKYAWSAGQWTGHGGTLDLELFEGVWRVDPSRHRYEWVE